ncbi:MAG: fasciclin domain-containing protein [Chitinophagaceae bacterium]|nr:fasciclin domain-containing protein [Chitinophagaceae bacterium]
MANITRMNMKNNILLLTASVLLLAACKRDEDIFRDIDYNRLGYLVSDNQDLSTFSAAIKMTGMEQTLLQSSPYTVFVPSDRAFLNEGAGYTAATIYQADGQWLSDILNYHVLDGYYDLNKMPFSFNQPVRTGNKHLAFVTHWVMGQDTVLTVNGVQVLAASVHASNGFAHVIDRVMTPNKYDNIVDRVAGEENLTLFSHAIQKSGMADILRQGQYTIFAPDNTAMMMLGYYNIQDVDVERPDILAQLVSRHVLEGIRFVYDYRITTPYTEIASGATGRYFPVDYYDASQGRNLTTQTYISGYRGSTKGVMLGGNGVTFTYAYGDTYDYVRNPLDRLALASGQTTMSIVDPRFRNLLSDNGVVHMISAALIP